MKDSPKPREPEAKGARRIEVPRVKLQCLFCCSARGCTSICHPLHHHQLPDHLKDRDPFVPEADRPQVEAESLGRLVVSRRPCLGNIWTAEKFPRLSSPP